MVLDIEAVKMSIKGYDLELAPYVGAKPTDANYLRLVRARLDAVNRRDKIVNAPAVTGVSHLERLPEELLVIIFSFLDGWGTVADKVCRRWHRLWRTRPNLNKLRNAGRYDAPIDSYQLNVGIVYSMIAGCDGRIWISRPGSILAIDPATKEVEMFNHSVFCLDLIGASKEGVPIYRPSGPTPIVVAISNTQILTAKYGSITLWDPTTGAKDLILDNSPRKQYVHYYSNGVGLYVLCHGERNGWFIQYSTLKVVPVTYYDDGSLWNVPIPGTGRMLAIRHNKYPVAGNLSDIAKRLSSYGIMVGGRLVTRCSNSCSLTIYE
jgi:hypothetical protein